MSDVGTNLLNGCTESRESIGDSKVDFAGICLSRNGVCLLEACFLAEDLVEFVNLRAVIVEDFHEGRLGSGRALGSTKP